MIVLFGSSGYVGSFYKKMLQSKGLDFIAPTHKEVDLADEKKLTEFLDKIEADFIINAVGYTGKPNVDACEENKVDCLLGNVIIPGILAKVCTKKGIVFGQVSSGCVYQGDKGIRQDGERIGFQEEDPPNFSFRASPCSFYSGCKALAEELLVGASCYIWRLRMPFHWQDHPKNYLSKLLFYPRLLDARNSLSEIEEFVRASFECWEKRLPFGIYHITNTGSITTREIIEKILVSPLGKKLRDKGKKFLFFENEKEFLKHVKAPRSNCVLDNSKLLSCGIKIRNIEEALEEDLLKWQESSYQ
ncbi:dTDP-4-dehydrorhamnose reductase [Candidatus Methylacidiphilum fumarolicum]|uniref:dTDP-4-dehydrorhamnose reductase n=2 Tax=Candidatus Methylacidiphilum fumarolicum TaxID=591154 RepID=I0K1E7_METFB|nr:sugar nucleotide-binding protein [Candidatus Methylacidiphilum fumarolicum]TFE70380.1 dTDP-4-dehydrorhamnose reductase [Candidatus Methylacidiphilum fumarolicum]TFE73939.1 dTDP-4-dehydrorhamnose reductase [Candidatus Methylacidiphilum fumarolicum]TFE74445.1 dTDP-4-dehydrorhamnose reductase [Candidatus Methylacidiphilum fumarolicum]TFE77893.1 dTDP-4-dehydrorhamnose reductase [Candidatus Methylacidiphilum fumarolicum]CAI9084435.1 dTDP-4-dehydrorhamnose reductase [Candidatus Methylacidiphilum 